MESDAERFFRAVDHGGLEHHSRPSDLPLLLAALPENQSIFRRVSHNPFLVAEGVDIHPEALPIDALRDLAWRVVEPQYLARLAELVEKFEGGKIQGSRRRRVGAGRQGGRGRTGATLLIEADCEVPGRIDAATGQIEFDNLANPEVDDVLDDLGGWF